MVNKFSSIGNACGRQKKLVDLVQENLLDYFLQCYVEHMEGGVGEAQDKGTHRPKHKEGILLYVIIQADEALVRDFFQMLQGLDKIQMERATISLYSLLWDFFGILRQLQI